MADLPQATEEKLLREALVASGPLPSLYQLCLRAACQGWLSTEQRDHKPAFVLDEMNETETTQIIDALRFERMVRVLLAARDS
jgi:hypothetical protein